MDYSIENDLRKIAGMRADGLIENSTAWKAAEEIAKLKAGLASCSRARSAEERECAELREKISDMIERCIEIVYSESSYEGQAKRTADAIAEEFNLPKAG